MWFPTYFGRPQGAALLLENIRQAIKQQGPQVILEVGGVDRPLLKRFQGYEVVGIDIDDRQECQCVYDRFLVQSVEERMPVQADVIVSMTLLEHVPNNEAAVRSMYASLNSGGSTHHYIPSKWHPYSICLRAVGAPLQKVLIRYLRPAAVEVSGYPAFFDHCTPSAMTRLFEKAGFHKIQVTAFYSAADYFAFFFPAYVAVATFENVCKLLGLRMFASGFVISAEK